jgi:hypothetical protein
MSDTLTTYLLELDFFDKSDWYQGEWHSEPDKVHWIDNETGYPCLIIRGPHGALNGYVGIPIYHPAYGMSYDGSTQNDHDRRSKAFRKVMRGAGKSYIDRIADLPESPVVTGIGDLIINIEVHGGLTYSGPTLIPTRNMWKEAKKSVVHRQAEALRYPKGDAAEWLKMWLPNIDDFDKWSKAVRDRTICIGHDDEELWWFGFDCAHAGDLCPKIESYLNSVRDPWPKNYVYRNMKYVENECRLLAKQLKELACYK